MSIRTLCGPILATCLLVFGAAGAAQAASAGQSLQRSVEGSAGSVVHVKSRGHDGRIYLPKGPGSIYYDYPYYYSRGYYPTHIGPGYAYYGYPYGDSSDSHASYRDQCQVWHRRCAARFGKGTEDYYGCMEDHDCD